jgi:hypothetical protein
MTHVKEWVLDGDIGWFESLIPCVKFGIGGAEALNCGGSERVGGLERQLGNFNWVLSRGYLS